MCARPATDAQLALTRRCPQAEAKLAEHETKMREDAVRREAKTGERPIASELGVLERAKRDRGCERLSREEKKAKLKAQEVALQASSGQRDDAPGSHQTEDDAESITEEAIAVYELLTKQRGRLSKDELLGSKLGADRANVFRNLACDAKGQVSKEVDLRTDHVA